MVADVNVYLMKVRFDWTKLTKSYLRMFLQAFTFLTLYIKIKVQKKQAKRILFPKQQNSKEKSDLSFSNILDGQAVLLQGI